MRKLFSLFTLVCFLSSSISLGAGSPARIVQGDVAQGFKNALQNASFDYPLFDSNWTTTTVTSAVETSTIIDGKKSAKLTYSSSTGDIKNNQIPIYNTDSQQMEATCAVNTAVTTMQVCSLIDGVESTCANVQPSGKWGYTTATFTGPTNGTSIGVKVKTTSSTSGTVYVDDCYVGPSRGIAQVNQASFVGEMDFSACNASWDRASASSSYQSAANTATCTYTKTGSIDTISGATLPKITITNAEGGDYVVFVTGQMNSVGTISAGSVTSFALVDGSNVYGESPILNATSNTATSGSSIIGRRSVTSGSTVNFEIQSKYPSGSGGFRIEAESTAPALRFMVYRFPSGSQLGINPGQPWQPTVTRILSGTGTYTTPANVSRIEVEMVGGGGGGGGGGTSIGTGGNGGATTFGTSLLVANGATAQTGGSASLGTGPIGNALSGGYGAALTHDDTLGHVTGGIGCSSPFGGAGAETVDQSTGNAAISNTGAGGGGGGANGTAGQVKGGPGGGCGGYVHAIINYPAASYSYSVGAAGTAGSAGTNGSAGGAGGSGIIIITEYYYNSAVQFAGQVSSPTSGQETIVRGHVGGSGTDSSPSVCSSDPCVVYSQSGSAITVNYSSTGTYTMHFPSGMFSGIPACTFTSGGATAAIGFALPSNTGTTTSIPVACRLGTNSGTSQNCDFYFICMGPR